MQKKNLVIEYCNQCLHFRCTNDWMNTYNCKKADKEITGHYRDKSNQYQTIFFIPEFCPLENA